MSTTVGDLAARLESLERTRHRLRVLVGVLVLLLVAVVSMGQDTGVKTPGLVRARKFELVDKEGRVRVEIRVTEKDEATLELMNPDRRVNLRLGSVNGMPLIHMFRKTGETIMAIGQIFHSSAIMLYDAKGRCRLEFVADGDGPHMSLFDKKAKRQASFLFDDSLERALLNINEPDKSK